MLRIFVSEICELCDALLYAPTEVYTSGNKTHSKLHNTFSLDNSNDWELSFDLKPTKSLIILSPQSNAETLVGGDVNKYLGMGSNNTNNKLCALGFTSDIDGSQWYTSGGSYGSGYHSLKITKVGNKYTYYYDGSEILNTTSNGFTAYTTLYLYFRMGDTNSSGYVKNIKIKTL